MLSRYRPSGIRTACAVLTTMLLVSCGDTEPMRSVQPSLFHQVSDGDVTLASCATFSTDFASALIGPDGGALSAGSTVVLIPQHAVRTPTRFTLRPLPGPTLRIRITADGHDRFGFARPIAVMIGYAHCPRQEFSGEVAVWHVEDRTSARLERMPTVHDRRNVTVGFLTTHLSTYAVAH